MQTGETGGSGTSTSTPNHRGDYVGPLGIEASSVEEEEEEQGSSRPGVVSGGRRRSSTGTGEKIAKDTGCCLYSAISVVVVMLVRVISFGRVFEMEILTFYCARLSLNGAS